MKFSIQLTADYADKSYGADRVYRDMLDQAVLGSGCRCLRAGLRFQLGLGVFEALLYRPL